MKRNIIILLLLCSTLAAEAKDNTPAQSSAKQQYQECVAVSMFTKQGREINAIAENNRAIEETNHIPEGWSVLGVTTQKEALVTTPYLVICR
ncbi:MAG: hypothetical protein LJE83_03185 [Gammaproteobacteria bacterium]|jgi:uncharacterized lipoprotein YajG|nr:hypothetical protein [Gammaproteobacteria bacterium]